MLFGRREVARRLQDSRPPAWLLSAKLLIASSVATVIGFSAICASVMLDMRRGEEELARQTLENLASGIDADISRNIELYDLSLRAVASNLVMPEIKGVSKEIRHLILFDHAATAKHFGAIQVFDAQGKLTIDAASARSGAGKPRRRGVFPGPSRQSRCRPVHQPPDAASRRLFDRAEPAHQRYRRRLSRRRRRLDPLQLFPRIVRPAEPRPRATRSPCCAATARSSCGRRSISTSSARIWRTARAGARTTSEADGSLMPGRARSIRRRGFMSAAAARVRSLSWSESRWRSDPEALAAGKRSGSARS